MGARVPDSVAVASTGNGGGAVSDPGGGGADGSAAGGGKEGSGALSGPLDLNLNFGISPSPPAPEETAACGGTGLGRAGSAGKGAAAGAVRGRNLMTGAESISSPVAAGGGSAGASGVGTDWPVVGSAAKRGFILRREVSAPADAPETGGICGGGAPSAGAADGRGFSFSDGGTSLMATIKTVSRRH